MSEPASVIPVFPLPNVVLFPKLQLPLHIFEPRYRQMVRDAMAHRGLIGMALLRGDWEKNYYANPEIYGIGCLGKIVGITPLPDGRYNILLHGLTEYEIEEEVLGETPYRQARVALRGDLALAAVEKTAIASFQREILELARGTIQEDDSPLMKILSDSTIDAATWLNLCCFSFDIAPVEKQSLLEAKSLQERAARLIDVLRFRAAERSTVEASHGSREGKLPH
ncbi:MAG: LON peptidase substrate-binding domain-containing protein [Candidatus Binatia bacterium]